MHPPIAFPKTTVNMNIENILDPQEEGDVPNRVPLGVQKGKEGIPNKKPSGEKNLDKKEEVINKFLVLEKTSDKSPPPSFFWVMVSETFFPTFLFRQLP